MVYKVPSPSKATKAKFPPFEFVIDGKPFTIPAFAELVTPEELFEIALLPLAEQNGVSLQRFAKAMPAEARRLFKSHGQITDLFAAWQKHGQQGVEPGESAASAD